MSLFRKRERERERERERDSTWINFKSTWPAIFKQRKINRLKKRFSWRTTVSKPMRKLLITIIHMPSQLQFTSHSDSNSPWESPGVSWAKYGGRSALVEDDSNSPATDGMPLVDWLVILTRMSFFDILWIIAYHPYLTSPYLWCNILEKDYS